MFIDEKWRLRNMMYTAVLNTASPFSKALEGYRIDTKPAEACSDQYHARAMRFIAHG
jgi:hypothetical protein